MEDMREGVTFIDLPDRKGKIRKTSSTDYGKVAKALGEIISAGISVSLIDINKSKFGFEPDAENNQILFGLKSLARVGDDIINKIIENRPYVSPKDFVNKVNPSKTVMISLIKSGAFDTMMDRKFVMAWYLWEKCDKKKNLTLQNMPGLIKYDMIPMDTEERLQAMRVYEFNRYLKSVCKIPNDKIYFHIDQRAIDFLIEFGYESLIFDDKINMKDWDKKYQKWMDVFRSWIAADKDNILKSLNSKIFKEEWDKYATGNLSSWEMETMCFYYHEHELANINYQKYGFSDFYKLPEEPVIDRSFMKGEKVINLYKLSYIYGTCIAKNKIKGSVTLLTPSGVVNVKFRKEHFALFDKRISEKQPDGTKKVKEHSWFERGSMIVVQGMRQGDNFIVKKYNNGTHQLYKIDEILENGNLKLRTERYKGEEEDDE